MIARSFSFLPWTLGCAVLLALPGRPVLGQGVNPPRDWTKNPVVVEIDTTETVYAVGDAHGDPERLFGVLAGAGLVDPTQGNPKTSDPSLVKWTGGKSVLVIPGDMIDKGMRSLDVITLLWAVQQTASDQGGQVFISMGNHEGEFLANPKGTKTSEFQAELTKAGMDPVAVAGGQTKVGAFLCGLPLAVRVNDWFFCHAGNTKNRTISKLSSDIQADYALHGFNGPEVVGDDSILEARLHDDGEGMKAWILNDSMFSNAKALLTAYAAQLGVHHIVQGHQYGKVDFGDGVVRPESAIYQRYGLLFLIDGGMSHGIKKKDRTQGGALKIGSPQTDPQEVSVICPDGTVTVLWSSKDQQDLGQQLCEKQGQ